MSDMNVDHFFSIGSAHQSQGRSCEDYALSGQLNSTTYFGVVADGCSGVTAHTDVGARALAWAFQRTLEETLSTEVDCFSEAFGEQILKNFKQFQYGLAFEDYLATLVGFVATREKVSVLAHGDGAVALRYTDGRMTLIELEWLNSMPMYLNYHLAPSVLGEFLRMYPLEDTKPFQKRTTVFTQDTAGITILSTEVQAYSTKDMMSGHVLQFQPQLESIECLAVLTDGYAQIGLKAPIEVTPEYLGYKNFQGEFVKRRMLRAVKEFHKENAVPRDDIGVATVWFNPANSD
jgi:hypothetical protein